VFSSVSSSLLWRGVLAVLIGVVSVAWPGVTVGAFVILFAAYAFLTAVADGVRAICSRQAGPVAGYLLLSLLSVAAGVTALVWPDITALVLTLWIGAWAVVTGGLQVALAFRPGAAAGERAMWILDGLMSIALGVVLFIRPDLGAVSLAVVFGLFTILSGVNSIVLGARLRPANTGQGQLAQSWS
jgi:uncharacterized membrane protein HdeD (DUF308 family)